MDLRYTLVFPNLFVCFIYSLHSVLKPDCKLSKVVRTWIFYSYYQSVGCLEQQGTTSDWASKTTPAHTINNNSYHSSQEITTALLLLKCELVSKHLLLFLLAWKWAGIQPQQKLDRLYILFGNVTLPGYKSTAITFNEGN